MKQLLLSLIFLILTTSQGWCVTNTWIGTTSTYSTATNWDLGHKPATGEDVVINNAANMNINETTAVIKSWNMAGYSGVVSGNGYIVLAPVTSTVACTLSGTMSAWTGTLQIQGDRSTINLTTNGILLNNITLTYFYGTNKVVLQDDLAFKAGKSYLMSLNTSTGNATGAFLDLNGHTISGNSTINRLLIYNTTLGGTSDKPGSLIVSTAGSGFANVDFRDVTTTTNIDLSAQTDIGDAGGNSGITFPPSVTQTVTGSSANWSTASWTSRVPLPQDDVVISLTAGQTLTADMPRLGRDISFTTGTNFTLGNAVTSYGSLDFTNAGTFTPGSNNWVMETNINSTLRSAGKSFSNVLQISGSRGAVILLDGFSSTSTSGFSIINNGIFNSNSQTVTLYKLLGATSGRTIIMNDSTWNLTGTGVVWEGTTTGTFQTTNSTINITDTSSTSKTFSGNGKSYHNLSTPSGTGGVIITGANSFNNISVGGKLTFPATTTTTAASLTPTGTPTLLSSTGGSPATVRSLLGTHSLTSTSIQDIAFTGNATWKCLTGCTNVSGNSGMNWTWTPRNGIEKAGLNKMGMN